MKKTLSTVKVSNLIPIIKSFCELNIADKLYVSMQILWEEIEFQSMIDYTKATKHYFWMKLGNYFSSHWLHGIIGIGILNLILAIRNLIAIIVAILSLSSYITRGRWNWDRNCCQISSKVMWTCCKKHVLTLVKVFTNAILVTNGFEKKNE